MTDELIERLRARKKRELRLSLTGVAWEPLVNPDGPEAADRLQSQSDRIAVQRDALMEAALALETLARRVFNDNGDHTIDTSPLDPDVFSACYYAAQTVRASLIKEGRDNG